MAEFVSSLRPMDIVLFSLLFLLLLIVIIFFLRLFQKHSQAQFRNIKGEENLADYLGRQVRDSELRLQSHQDALSSSLYAQLQLQHNMVNAFFERLDQRLDASLQNQDSRLKHLDEVLNTRLGSNDQKVGEMRETLFSSLTQMQKDNAAKLEEMRKTVDEHLHQTLNKRLGESFSLVNERLEAVYKGLGEMRTLASGVGDLKKVLTNIKTRGTWGETQLHMLLNEVLSPAQYETNCALVPGSAERVEFAVRLPGQEDGRPVYLPIDAKFPLEDYERLQTAQEAADKVLLDLALSSLERAVLREGERIASKYVVPPYTTDFAILYLPVEGLYAEVLRLPGLAEKLQRQFRVSLAGPTTLLALLNSLQMGFRTLAIQQRSAEVWRLLAQVKGDFMAFGDILEKTQNRLRQASESIDLANRRTRSITRRLGAVESLEGEPLALPDEEPQE